MTSNKPEFKSHRYRGRIVYRPPDQPQEYDDPRAKRLELTRAQLEQMFPRMTDLPISMEHHGGRCGRVIRPYFDEDGSACIEFELDTDSLPGQQAFTYMCCGMIGLSLSHDANTLDPVEISICLQGARENTGVLEVVRDQTPQTTPGAYIHPNSDSDSQATPILVQASSAAASEPPSTIVCNSFVSLSPATKQTMNPTGAPAPVGMQQQPPAPTQQSMQPQQFSPQEMQRLFELYQQQQQQPSTTNNNAMQSSPASAGNQQQPTQSTQDEQQSTQGQDQQQQQPAPEDEDNEDVDPLATIVRNNSVNKKVKQRMVNHVKQLTEEQLRLAAQNESLRKRNERLEKEISDSNAMMQATLAAMLQKLGAVQTPELSNRISQDMLQGMDHQTRQVLVQASENAMKLAEEMERIRSDLGSRELLAEVRNIHRTRHMAQHMVTGATQSASAVASTPSPRYHDSDMKNVMPPPPAPAAAAVAMTNRGSFMYPAAPGSSSSSSSAAASSPAPMQFNAAYSGNDMWQWNTTPTTSPMTMHSPNASGTTLVNASAASSGAAAASSSSQPNTPRRDANESLMNAAMSRIMNANVGDRFNRTLYANPNINRTQEM